MASFSQNKATVLPKLCVARPPLVKTFSSEEESRAQNFLPWWRPSIGVRPCPVVGRATVYSCQRARLLYLIRLSSRGCSSQAQHDPR